VENEYAAKQEMVCYMGCFLFSKELKFLQNYIREREQKMLSGAEFEHFSFIFYSQTSNNFFALMLESI